MRQETIALFLIALTVLFGALTGIVIGGTSPYGGSTTIVPNVNPLLFGSSGNVKIDIPKPGIAVRIEIPREFLGSVSSENDTSFITSNVRNDYYYYNVVDESLHWTYRWRNNQSDGPCFKPEFSFYDPNAPWCVEIWNYINAPSLQQPTLNVSLGTAQTLDYTTLVGVDYCQTSNLHKFVFACFSPPKFVQFKDLNAPPAAGSYNFTLSVANRTNILGYPDFVHAWNTTLIVPVSMSYNAGYISGFVCDGNTTACSVHIGGKGIVYGTNLSTGQIARAYINQTLCYLGNINCGLFNLTGLAPGPYRIQASAGVDNGIAYSLSTYPSTPAVTANRGSAIGGIPLRRAPQVCGTISYQTSAGGTVRSLTDNPYLIAAGFRANDRAAQNLKFNLNITVEATDNIPNLGHVYRFQGISSDTTTDSFAIITGSRVKYVSETNPTSVYGTEFAGLPAPEDVGSYTLTIRVWISGYLQKTSLVVSVTQSPGVGSPFCSYVVPVTMTIGNVISGTLQFWNLQSLETPAQAEASLPLGTNTEALFGGNVLIQAYDASGILRGVTVINGSLPNGKTSFANSSSLRFYVIGFTEYFNHSLSGVWAQNDLGLPSSSYGLHVFMRGYELTLQSPSPVTLTNGGNATVTVQMTRGGVFQVLVGSYDNRFGTRTVQAAMPWKFLNLTIPVTARTYFYASNGLSVGFVEVLMVSSTTGPVTSSSFSIVFAGQNWSLREIWFYNFIPTHITNDTYTIRAYTLGYVRQNVNGIQSFNDLVGFAQAFITLFIANEIDVTVPIFAAPQTFGTTPEYDHAIGQVYSGTLAGAEMYNVSARTPTLSFTIFGFGGMILPGIGAGMIGQGHFFYVAPSGLRYFDYGLDVGTYTANLPEFGFTVHYLQVAVLPTVTFNDLFLENGVFLSVYQMARIMQGSFSSVTGYTDPPLDVTPLSWARVQASNSTYSRSISIVDGQFEGVGALQLPAGTYTITFSDVQYNSQTILNFQVQWGSVYSLIPLTPLLPV